MQKTSDLHHLSHGPADQQQSKRNGRGPFSRLAYSFHAWIFCGYLALLMLFAGALIVSYQQLAGLGQQATLVRLQGNPDESDLLAIERAVGHARQQMVVQNLVLLVVGALAALGATYAIGGAVLRPLRALDRVLVAIRHGTSPHLDDTTTPTEIQPLVQSYNAMSDTLELRQSELYDQLRRTALLTRLSLELRESLDPATIVRDVLTSIVSNVDGSSASIIMIDGMTNVAQAAAIRDHQHRQMPTDEAYVLLDQGLAGWVLRHGFSVVLPDVRRDDRWLKLHPAHAVGSAMALPLTHTRATLGVLTITHPERDHFTSKDLLLLEGVAGLVGVALNAAQRHMGEQRRREQALLLFAMSQSLTLERSLDDLAQELLQSSRSAFNAAYTALFLCDHQGGPPMLAASFPSELKQEILPATPATGDPQAVLHRYLTTVAEQAWRSHKPVSGALPTLTQGAASTQPPWQQLTPAYVALPLLHNGNAIGVFVLVCETRGAVVFSADMWSVLTTFTNVAAAAFANLQLVERLHQRAALLEQEVSERTLQLQHSRDLLRVVFDNLPDGLVLLDNNATILTVNHAFCKGVVGGQPQQIVTRHFPSIMEQLQRDKQMQIEPPLNDGPMQRILCTDQSGQQRWYDIDRYVIAHGDHQQRIERWRDVTQQEQILQQLLLHEQLASMGRLAVSVVHEVGNPLQSVRGCLDLCREDADLSPSSADYLALADSELDRMSHILDRLRDLYRPPEWGWEQVQLNELVAIVKQITERQLERSRIKLLTELAAGLPEVYAQRDALRQLLIGLILNAQEAMPMGGTIVLHTAYDPTRRACRLQLRDTGVGMTPEQLDHIFEPCMSRKGLGLGLYLSKQIIDQHYGSMAVESTPGVGTTVTLWLPDIEHDHEKSNRSDR